jgi:hypothetical protein
MEEKQGLRSPLRYAIRHAKGNCEYVADFDLKVCRKAQPVASLFDVNAVSLYVCKPRDTSVAANPDSDCTSRSNDKGRHINLSHGLTGIPDRVQ